MSFAETFKALSDPVRREILMLLKKGTLSAGEIGSHFDMTGATISYHLGILKKADLICETKYKNYVYYELNISAVEDIMLWLADLKGEVWCERVQRKKYFNKCSDGSSDCNRIAFMEPASGYDSDAFYV